MDINNLVTMVNRIGDFFASMPDRDEAKDGIVQHLHKFWEPRMRKALVENLDNPATAALHPLVREAITDRPDLLPRRD